MIILPLALTSAMAVTWAAWPPEPSPGPKGDEPAPAGNEQADFKSRVTIDLLLPGQNVGERPARLVLRKSDSTSTAMGKPVAQKIRHQLRAGGRKSNTTPGNEYQPALSVALKSPETFSVEEQVPRVRADVEERAAIARKLALPMSSATGTSIREAPTAPAGSVAPVSPIQYHEVTVARGEALFHIFRRLELSQADLLSIAGRHGVAKSLTNLRPGRLLEITADKNGRIVEVVYHERETKRVVVERNGDAFSTRTETGEVRTDQTSAPEAPHLFTAVPSERSQTPDLRPASSPSSLVENKSHVKKRLALVDEPSRAAQLPVDQRTLPNTTAQNTTTQNTTTALVGQSVTGEDSASANKPTQKTPMARPHGAPAVIRMEVASGDSMSSLFQAHKIPARELAALLTGSASRKTLRRIDPGQTLEVYLHPDRRIAKLDYHTDESKTIRYTRSQKDTFDTEVIEHPITAQHVSASGTIKSSLFVAARKAGLSHGVTMQLAEIFGWDLDFVLDIRVGDHFSLIYEELYRSGKKIGDGEIVAAEFVNQGRTLRALRFVHDNGAVRYYTPDGMSMRKAFLRSPVTFSRISSRFSHARRHPVLHKFRAHKGVDYAAARGTPVRAAGDGRVILAGRKGAYGKTIVLQHGSAFTTLYAHLHRFGKNIRSGMRVSQGQVIGYVGSTGLATGPHLHYEFRVRGIHRDPLKVRLPKAAPIAQDEKAKFLEATAPALAQLNTLTGRLLADSSQTGQ